MFVGALVLLSALPSPADVFFLNTASGPPFANESGTGYQDRLTREALGRVGRAVSIERVPGERSLQLLSAGIDDGTAVRVAGLEAMYENFVMVPEPAMSWEFVAFSTRENLDIRSWTDLEGLEVAYITGWKIFQLKTPPGARRTEVRNTDTLFTLLENGRCDVVLFEKWQGLYELNERELDAKQHHPPLAVPKMYIYLHRDHAALVEPLTESLRALKADGTEQRIFDETLEYLRD